MDSSDGINHGEVSKYHIEKKLLEFFLWIMGILKTKFKYVYKSIKVSTLNLFFHTEDEDMDGNVSDLASASQPEVLLSGYSSLWQFC